MLSYILLSVIRMVVLLALPVFAAENAAGKNLPRIENEYKLNVPDQQTEAVWHYLKRVYDPQHPGFILKDVPGTFETSFSKELFLDSYFDTPNLEMLQLNSGIRQRKRYFPDDPKNKKNGRELIQIKLSSDDHQALNRTEIKFDVKYYDQKKTIEDRHPLIGMLKKSDRANFKTQLEKVGIFQPLHLLKVINLRQERSRVYIARNGEAFATITLDDVVASRWWSEVSFNELELELNEINYTQGDADQRAFMESINQRMMSNILSQFPQIKQDQTPKYNKSYNLIQTKFYNFPWALKLGMPIEAIAIFMGFILMIGAAFFGYQWHRAKRL